MPYKSEKQKRFLRINKPEVAKIFESHSGRKVAKDIKPKRARRKKRS